MRSLKPSELFKLLELCWSRDTSADPDDWTRENPAWGQCAVTALVVQDFLGGGILRASLEDVGGYEYMRSHYWNRLPSGAQLDLSQRQFDRLAYDKIPPGEPRTREYLLSNEETRNRFTRLRLAIEAELKGSNLLPAPFFFDAYYQECFTAAQLSDCQKMRVGCIAVHNGVIVARAANQSLEPLKNLCESECIRFKITSRTESMIGSCGHAEEYALHEVISKGIALQECSFYVASFALDNTPHYRKFSEFTCIRCATQLYMGGLGAIHLTVRQDHWESITSEEALRQANRYALRERKP